MLVGGQQGSGGTVDSDTGNLLRGDLVKRVGERLLESIPPEHRMLLDLRPDARWWSQWGSCVRANDPSRIDDDRATSRGAQIDTSVKGQRRCRLTLPRAA